MTFITNCARIVDHFPIRKFHTRSHSAGQTVYNVLLKMLATLLVLKTLSLQFDSDHTFPVEFSPKVIVMDPSAVTPPRFKQNLVRATDFIASTDKKYPSLYSRLEMGSDWSSVLDTTLKLFV